MSNLTVQYINIDAETSNQRLDNFLFRILKNVPKTHVYKLLRRGEIRVNKKRVKQDYRLQVGDILRLPPIKQDEKTVKGIPPKALFDTLKENILYEDSDLLIINKPAGLSVHAGSNVTTGLIETLRHYLLDHPTLELAHRLDRGTSGCLILAKRRAVLNELHTLLREGLLTKTYWALVCGRWPKGKQKIDAPLLKNVLASGERMVKVDLEGKESQTLFKPLENFANATLVEAQPQTGRTHQIRVHSAHAGHPIAGDDKYGDREFNRSMREFGLKRMFLHAASVSFKLQGRLINATAELDPVLSQVLEKLKIKEI